ncbi:hypothetical protein FC093_23105 [Ilyomonas limi]|uniref:Uncharacterized protein n=1 Tax=Ilyomonas limi TaxID=2575867 RepID=A0A4U3KRA6_9BACT|nr:hypothetical protein [Ilyomonas limi]TKK64159.1 hypothetical protein FC093_23105 [Ilyomonas limi]
MTKKAILVTATFIGFCYCFRFGYIWTAYGHGGQILGVPFALIMLFTTILSFTAKTNKGKDTAFIFGIIYFLTLAAFSVTIEIIRATMTNYFDFLYYEPNGYVDKIFLSWLIIGAVAFLLTLRQMRKKRLEDGKLKVDTFSM